MRISKDPDHPDHSEYAGHCAFFLEGAERHNVLTADEAGRFAVTYRLDEWGAMCRDEKTGQPLTDRFWGHVRIVAPQWLRDATEKLQKNTKAV
jgi:hypothetical protein